VPVVVGRDDHQALLVLCFSARYLHAAWIGLRLVDQLCLTALQQGADDAFTAFYARRLDRVGRVADGDDRAVRIVGRIRQENRAVVDGEQVLGVARDAIHHRREIEGRRQVAADFG